MSRVEKGDIFTLDFPLRPARPIEAPAVGKAIGADPSEVLASTLYLVVFDQWDQVVFYQRRR